MSQDLLAEFGSFSVNDTAQPSPTSNQNGTSTNLVSSTAFHNAPSRPHEPVTEVEDDIWAGEDDDDFGDFEVAGEDLEEELPSQAIHSKPELEPEPRSRPQPVEKTKSNTTSTKTSQNTSKPNPPAAAKVLHENHPFANIPDILFDAENSDEAPEVQDRWHYEAGEDEFGDFETTSFTPAAPKHPDSDTRGNSVLPPQSEMFDLLGLDDGPRQVKEAKVPTARLKTGPKTRKVASTTRSSVPAKAKVLENQEEEFASWDDFESVQIASAPSVKAPISPQQKQQQQQQQQSKAPQPEITIDLPTDLLGPLLLPAPTPPPSTPTTIPPPSLLLTLFPPLLSLTVTSLLHPLSLLPSTQKPHFLHLPATQTYLNTYLTATHVLAHVIAGRKVRWKRDKFLAQSMRMGPSVSGRSGGMKLVGLDGSEGRREDVQVEDLLRGWREQVGRLKSAVSTATTGTGASGAAGVTGTAGGKKAMLVVPGLALTMPVRVAQTVEGGVVSTAACAFCGLKREERVGKVDVDVEDSFGEWWVEGTNMHTRCLHFWNAHKETLRGR